MYLEFSFQLSKLQDNKHLSTNFDRFPTAVPQTLAIPLTGLLSLCVLTRPYSFPEATCDGSINFCQVLH